MSDQDLIRVGLCQMQPVWMNRDSTLARVEEFIASAHDEGCGLAVFGEALVPGYPFWLDRTDGARFDHPLQKEIHSLYLKEAVSIPDGHLDGVRALCRDRQIAVVLGIIERGMDRGGHTVYASAVYIGPDGAIGSVHRKLMPTYEERLVWGTGDGHGLRVHSLPPFTVGALNCWENWMPLARASLYAQGEDLHVAIWPGGVRLTEDITRFAAREGRSYAISAGGLMHADAIPAQFPARDRMIEDTPGWMANGGSCVAGPDGNWVVEPIAEKEGVFVADLDHARVREERQNFDAAGHYARPDVLRLEVNRVRQTTARFHDEPGDESGD